MKKFNITKMDVSTEDKNLSSLAAYIFILIILLNLTVDFKQKIERPWDHSGDDTSPNRPIQYGTGFSGTFTGSIGSTAAVVSMVPSAQIESTPILDKNGNSYYVNIPREVEFINQAQLSIKEDSEEENHLCQKL